MGMHILYVENAPGFGGSTRCVMQLARAAVQRGWRATVALRTPLPDGESLPEGTSALSWRGSLPGQRPTWQAVVRSAMGLAAWIKRHQPQIIHANNELLANRGAILASVLTGVPVVSHQRGWAWAGLASRWLAHRTARIIAISDAVKADLHRVGVGAPRVTRIYDGLDLGLFASGGLNRSTFRARFGIRDGDFVVGLPGVVTPWKGHEFFLRTFAKTRHEISCARALIVGQPLPHEAHLLHDLRALAGQLNIADAVIFAGHQSEMASAYAAMDVVAHASIEPEPLGLVVLEAMACGKPVVAAQAGGPAEIITHGQDGLLYPPCDTAALALSIKRIFEDHDLGRALATHAQRRVKDFTFDNCFRKTADLYDEVAEQASARRFLRGAIAPWSETNHAH